MVPVADVLSGDLRKRDVNRNVDVKCMPQKSTVDLSREVNREDGLASAH